MERSFENEADILLTTPDLPLENSFTFPERSGSPHSDYSVCSCSETERSKPKQPYVCNTRLAARHALHKEAVCLPLKEDKTSIMATEATYMSGDGRKVRSARKMCKNKRRLLPAKRKRSLRCEVLGKNFLKHQVASQLLKEYWQRKAEIEGKYKKVINAIDREEVLELKFNISKASDANIIENLGDIREYYEGSRMLLPCTPVSYTHLTLPTNREV
eukprot:TRINITY_DN22454_c0_g2_i1.p1 TRINITY_DN22454_c0_g2~~TRINITY_DN22454_c0_g2_i1.p1  ORF type:complete len:216 (-),score=50.90 TRINITY_DN22454_c0_g2_i1:38-685(-)